MTEPAKFHQTRSHGQIPPGAVDQRHLNEVYLKRAQMRGQLAANVLIGASVVAGIGLVMVGLFSIHIGAVEGAAMFQTTFALIFGALSAWGGAVIAFYFGGDNFEAGARASENILEISQRNPETAPDKRVDEVMIPLDKIDYRTGADTDAIDLDAIANFYADEGRNRLILLTHDLQFVAVLHKSTYDAARRLDSNLVGTSSLKTLIDSLKAKDKEREARLIDQVAFGAPQDCLQTLKDRIGAIEGCQDGFVTLTGQNDGPVTGYVTDAIVAQNAAIL